MFNILSVVEISVIFLAWQLNVQVHSQVCYPSNLIELIHAREKTVRVKMKHCTVDISYRGRVCAQLDTHTLRLQSCRSGVCETLTQVGEKRVFQTPGGALNMSSCQDRPPAVRGERCRAPLLLCGCWAIFLSCLFVQISKTQRKPDRTTTTPPSMRWE